MLTVPLFIYGMVVLLSATMLIYVMTPLFLTTPGAVAPKLRVRPLRPRSASAGLGAGGAGGQVAVTSCRLPEAWRS
jgi:hypothetical protein